MRIAYSFHDASFFCGGPWVNAIRILPEFAKRGHEVHAVITNVTPDVESRAETILSALGVACHVIPYTIYTEDRVISILKTLATIEPDVYVSNVTIAGGYAGHWLKRAGIPTISAHVSEDNRNWAIAETFSAGSPDWATSGTFCISQDLYNKLVERKPCNELALICHGAPIPESTANQDEVKQIVFAGRLDEPQKRTLRMMETVTRALKKFPELRFKVVGDGPEKDKAISFVRDQGVSDRVTFINSVPPERIYSMLQDCQLSVLLSDYEGLPGAVIDAAMCGLVPLCHSVPGGIHELVLHEETGILLRNCHDEFDLWVERLIRDHHLRKRLAANAREHMIRNYSLQRCVDDWEVFMARLVSQSLPKKKIGVPDNIQLPPRNSRFQGYEDLRRPKKATSLASISALLSNCTPRNVYNLIRSLGTKNSQ